jgi:hypothetical protein
MRSVLRVCVRVNPRHLRQNLLAASECLCSVLCVRVNPRHLCPNLLAASVRLCRSVFWVVAPCVWPPGGPARGPAPTLHRPLRPCQSAPSVPESAGGLCVSVSCSVPPCVWPPGGPARGPAPTLPMRPSAPSVYLHAPPAAYTHVRLRIAAACAPIGGQVLSRQLGVARAFAHVPFAAILHSAAG